TVRQETTPHRRGAAARPARNWMTSGGGTRDSDYHSSTLPRGTFARSIFDNHLVRLSDRGGASQLIGTAWSNAVADELDAWSGGPVPGEAPRLAGSVVEEIHRLD